MWIFFPWNKDGGNCFLVPEHTEEFSSLETGEGKKFSHLINELAYGSTFVIYFMVQVLRKKVPAMRVAAATAATTAGSQMLSWGRQLAQLTAMRRSWTEACSACLTLPSRR
jgi:hypothetical protein